MNEKTAFFSEAIPVNLKGCLEKKLVLPEGKYTVSCFHDANNSGGLDKNWMGIPKEPYGFTGNYSSRVRPPNWEETSVPINPGQTVEVKLRNW